MMGPADFEFQQGPFLASDSSLLVYRMSEMETFCSSNAFFPASISLHKFTN